MREIKFRAWDGENMNSEFIIVDTAWMMNKEVGCPVNAGFKNMQEQAENWIIMQYTGLKDKNGKEIYEGDIVKDWENIDLYEVVWNRRYACFELNRLTFGNDTGQEIDNSPLDLEIVGNIYENKDLLEAKEI